LLTPNEIPFQKDLEQKKCGPLTGRMNCASSLAGRKIK